MKDQDILAPNGSTVLILNLYTLNMQPSTDQLTKQSDLVSFHVASDSEILIEETSSREISLQLL